MKKKYCLIFILLTLFLSYSCREESIMLFSDRNEIYFDKFFMNAIFPGTQAADSTETSFFFFPENIKYLPVDLVVNLSGMPLLSDIYFGLKVIPEETTATPQEYLIEERYTFRANNISAGATQIQDTIQIKFIKSSRMDQMPEGVRLMVELVPMGDIGIGQYERTRAVIRVRTIATKPSWWTTEVEIGLLGKYSQKKYRLFLNNIDKEATLNERLIKERPDEAIKLALKFKQWLSEQDIETITDDDGTIISVPV